MKKSPIRNKTSTRPAFAPTYSPICSRSQKLRSKYNFLQNLISQYERQIQQNLIFFEKGRMMISQSPSNKLHMNIKQLQPQSTSEHHREETQDKRTSISQASQETNPLQKPHPANNQAHDLPNPKFNTNQTLLQQSHNIIMRKYFKTNKVTDNSPSNLNTLMSHQQDERNYYYQVGEFQQELMSSEEKQLDDQESEQMIPLVESLYLTEEMVGRLKAKGLGSSQPQIGKLAESSQFEQIDLLQSPQSILSVQKNQPHHNQSITQCYILSMCLIFLTLLMLCI